MAQQNRTTQFGEQARSSYEELKEQAGETLEQTAEMVRQHPAGSALAIFGIGFGLGLVATALMMPSHPRRRRFERMTRDWLPRESIESLGERVSRLLPESWSRYMD